MNDLKKYNSAKLKLTDSKIFRIYFYLKDINLMLNIIHHVNTNNHLFHELNCN